jgi:hypothetical protein
MPRPSLGLGLISSLTVLLLVAIFHIRTTPGGGTSMARAGERLVEQRTPAILFLTQCRKICCQ